MKNDSGLSSKPPEDSRQKLCCPFLQSLNSSRKNAFGKLRKNPTLAS